MPPSLDSSRILKSRQILLQSMPQLVSGSRQTLRTAAEEGAGWELPCTRSGDAQMTFSWVCRKPQRGTMRSGLSGEQEAGPKGKVAGRLR